MPTGMLGKLPLHAVRGPRDTLEERLAGADGEIWLTELNRFLRKGPCWLSNDSLVIDGDAKPPAKWGDSPLEEHRRNGKFSWDVRKVSLYQHEDQLAHPTHKMRGLALYEQLRFRKEIANILVMKYLLEYQGLLPESWQSKKICFWGTIYTDEKRPLTLGYIDMYRVPYIFYDRHKKVWSESSRVVSAGFDGTLYALLLESA